LLDINYTNVTPQVFLMLLTCNKQPNTVISTQQETIHQLATPLSSYVSNNWIHFSLGFHLENFHRTPFHPTYVTTPF
jgi:hypothetical protein